MMGRYGGNYDYGFGNSMMAGGGFGWVLMFVFGALIIAGVVLLVVWMMRMNSGHGHVAGGTVPPAAAAGHDEAVAVAKRRLASGEIDTEQYEGIMRSLSS